MRKFILSFILLFCTLSVFPITDTLFNELERVLSKKDVYTQQKLERIERLKSYVKKSDGHSLRTYNQYVKIFEEYKTLNFDSALTYAGKIKQEAESLKDPAKISHSKINIAFILLSSGMFKETHEEFKNIEIKNLSYADKVELLSLKARYYYDLCDFVKNDTYCSAYISLGNELADSAMVLAPRGSYRYYFISGLKNLRTGNLDDALRDYLQIVDRPTLTQHQYAIIASTLSYIYLRKQRNNQAMQFLIKAAIADVKSSTKENVAMFKLADTLFETGDNEKAYKYIRMAMADAEYYGARHRQFEVGTLLPIIEGKQLMMVEKQKNVIITYAAIVTLLIVIIAGFIVVTIKQNKKLQLAQVIISEANDTLQKTNLELTEVNKAIREANRIKDEYIGYYFNINSDYIDKIERFKKSVSQRLTLGRYDEIKQIINKIDLKKEREDLSVSFDRVFIKLFPYFLKEFNGLFDEKDRIILPDGQLLNTELRIFALIRLGIHDNDRIAKVMNFSVNTIYAYKTRIKNKSFISNDEFEDKIMAIKAD
ncbi:DUF6377 domain-containing protein [Arcticibacter eurypsychrophilus]|uniref:DUF6377 domain-containing protein n=1 Tax=Arcticibacter eurypsychrophilus TaxID=1434752 RepID=UPI00084CE8CF|nr:DUF6377 domain-containing protein [Arcticibacter eurypsychrophilus]